MPTEALHYSKLTETQNKCVYYVQWECFDLTYGMIDETD